jgi:hypothetical protein
VTLSKEEQAKFETNQSAWTAVILASRNKVFGIVGSVSEKDTHKAWEQLKKEVFVPNKAKDFAKMNKEFKEVRMKDKMGYAKIYIRELEQVDQHYKSVNSKYTKDDMEMITHLFSVVMKMYGMPITWMTQSGIKSHKEVEAEIADYWERFIEKKQPKELTNQVLAIKNNNFGSYFVHAPEFPPSTSVGKGRQRLWQLRISAEHELTVCGH